jgi:hypothetical protein
MHSLSQFFNKFNPNRNKKVQNFQKSPQEDILLRQAILNPNRNFGTDKEKLPSSFKNIMKKCAGDAFHIAQTRMISFCSIANQMIMQFQEKQSLWRRCLPSKPENQMNGASSSYTGRQLDEGLDDCEPPIAVSNALRGQIEPYKKFTRSARTLPFKILISLRTSTVETTNIETPERSHGFITLKRIQKQ